MKNKPSAISMILILFVSSTMIMFPVKPANANSIVIRTLFDQDVTWAHVKVEEYADSVKWTIDLDESSAYLNNPVAGIVVIIGLGNEIEFQIHNNDGVDPHYSYGTWLISYYDGGWRTGSPYYLNYPLPDGIIATGGRSKSENPQMVFTVTIAKSYLANEFKWAVYFKGGSGGRTFYPPDFSWSDTNTSDMATAKYLILGGVVAALAKATGTNAQYYWGSGCWAAVLGQKFEVYIDPTLPPFNALGTFTVDDIASISYHTNTPHPITGTTPYNFYLVVYTNPDGINDHGWYGYKLIGEPYFSNNLNAPADQWNKWSTDAGTNQLTFFDPDTIGFYGFYGQPTLQNIQAGPINWHDYYSGCPETNIDYGVEVVKYISLQTATSWMNIFQGYMDAITIALKDGTTVSIDLEGFASEVWVDDDWAGLPPGTEVEPGKFIGYNAFAKIQDAINAAAGTTICVYEGVYNENLVINKSLALHGINKETTIINGLGYTDTIKITASDVTISGFTIRQEKKLFGVNTDTSVRQSNIVLYDNIFDQCSYNYLYSVDYAKVYDNEFRSSGLAIWRSVGGEVYNNNISTFGVGIALYWVNETTVKCNKIFAPNKDVYSDIGIHAQYCEELVIWNNEIFNFTAGPKQYYTYGTSGAAINVYVSKVINVQCNDLHDNSIGVLIQRLNLTTEPREVNIHYNNLEGNTEFGVLNCYTWIGKDKTYTPTNESFIVNARYNWWGHETGPYHGTSWTYMGSPYGPHYGLGDNVSDYVLYDHWLETRFTPPPVHDVAIISVVPSSIRVAIGTVIQVDVTVKNEGSTYETFDVSLYYDSSLIGTQTITDLAPSSTQLLTFNWDTTDTTPGTDYTLTAIATTVPGETDTADNTKSAIDKVRVGEPPSIKIEPPTYGAKRLNEIFSVNITISNLRAYWKVVGLQFRVTYNDTYLKVLSVTEGPFMKQYGNTFFIEFIETSRTDPLHKANVLIGILILPPWNVFPNGDGLLATITFQVIYQERAEMNPPLPCNIGLTETKIIDNVIKNIPHNVAPASYMIYPTHLCDINYDGVVDISDIALVAYAFGSYPGHPNWNLLCDLNADKMVDIYDVASVAFNFGWQTDP